MPQTVGYARVSTNHQSLDAQLDALNRAGCERTFTDQLSGAVTARPGLTALLEHVRAGDTVVVVALDRLGRSLCGVIATIEDLTAAGAMLRSLREGVDYTTPMGRVVAGIFTSLAVYERELMHERTAMARAAALERGRPPGRPAKLTAAQARQARSLREAGETVTEIGRSLQVSRATVYRALADAS